MTFLTHPKPDSLAMYAALCFIKKVSPPLEGRG
jgi:hypothetical protein